MNEKSEIFNEILEHTKDCDFNRSAHFLQYCKYKKLASALNLSQVICLILTIVAYILYFNLLNNLLKYGSVIISVITAIVSIISLYYSFSDLANCHWLAAQSYTQLYRKCQFFHIENIRNLDINVLLCRTQEITDQLNNLNLNAPHINEKTYESVNKANLKNKTYPIQKFIDEKDIGLICHEITKIICEILTDYKINIYLYGSSIKSISYNDIDIAIIFYSKIDNYNAVYFSNLIEKMLLTKGIFADIFIEESDIFYKQHNMFFINIRRGILIFQSYEIEELGTPINYDYELKQLKKFYNLCIDSYNNKDINSFIIYCYYTYIFYMESILYDSNTIWCGENDLKKKFYEYCFNHPIYFELMQNIKTIEKHKNRILFYDKVYFKDSEIDACFNNIKKLVGDFVLL